MASRTGRDAFAIVVHAFVWNEDRRLLMLRRANTGFMDGAFTLPGGHRQRRETVVDAVVRECREEACVEVEAIRPVAVLPYAEGVNMLFEATAWRGAPAIGEPDKCDRLVFADPQRVPEPTAPFVATALACLREGRWFAERQGASAARLRGGADQAATPERDKMRRFPFEGSA